MKLIRTEPTVEALGIAFGQEQLKAVIRAIEEQRVDPNPPEPVQPSHYKGHDLSRGVDVINRAVAILDAAVKEGVLVIDINESEPDNIQVNALEEFARRFTTRILAKGTQ